MYRWWSLPPAHFRSPDPDHILVLGLSAWPGSLWAQGNLAGDWTGTLTEGSQKYRYLFHIIQTQDGLYVGSFKDPDEGFSAAID
jgi:hypothetical protein